MWKAPGDRCRRCFGDGRHLPRFGCKVHIESGEVVTSRSGWERVACPRMGDVAPEAVENTIDAGVAEMVVVGATPAEIAAAVVVSEMVAGWTGEGLRHRQSKLGRHPSVQVSGN